MRKNKTISIMLLVVMLIITSCSGKGANQPAALVETGVITKITVVDKIETTGNLNANQMMSLTWGTTGLVEKIHVETGQKVTRGTILASLKLDTVPADIVTAQSELATAQRDLQDLNNSSTALAEAQLAVIKARKTAEVAENYFTALSYPRASTVLIKNTQAKIYTARQEVTLATRRYKEVQRHLDGDPQKTEALLNLTNAQMKLNELIATLNWYTGKPTQSDFDEAKAKVDVARAALEDARRKRDNIKSGTDPLVIAAAKAKVDAAQARVNAVYILAPFDGEIISIWAKAGDSASMGKTAVEIVNRETFEVETTVGEAEVSTISIGDSAEVTLDSLPEVKLTGKVSRISKIGKLINGLVNYTVMVALDPTDQPLLLGATANVTLITGESHDMLAAPVGAIQVDQEGEYVMAVSSDGQMQRINIQSSTISSGLVTIRENETLKEGDLVQIKAPEPDPNMGFGG